MNETEVDEMLEHGGVQELNFQRLAMSDTNQARQVLADLNARHNDIIKLESSIRELHDMMLDMALLVESQGEVVIRIEQTVGQATEHVVQAKTDVQRADVYKKKSRQKKIILGIIAVAVVAIVIGVVVIVIVTRN
uniref:t-SNARE coiled-coil homology domain-containing protein n=1 Tax=Plectus sambesii TaxID=2011161 RepID=A0A914WHC1_9BILA